MNWNALAITSNPNSNVYTISISLANINWFDPDPTLPNSYLLIDIIIMENSLIPQCPNSTFTELGFMDTQINTY